MPGGPRTGAGGPRVGSGGAGRPKKIHGISPGTAQAASGGQEGIPGPSALPAGIVGPDLATSETPLAYMLRVINDPAVDDGRRDRLAVAAAPYLHPKAGEGGKKEQKASAAKTAGLGKFAPAGPPKLVSSR